MEIEKILTENPFIICEGSIIERLRREFNVTLDPYIINSGLIYDTDGKAALEAIYSQYMDIGRDYDFPMFILTPTWRANFESIIEARLEGKNVNADCYNLVSGVRERYKEYSEKIYIGGLMGSKGDAYDPSLALTADAAYLFHSYQVDALSNAGVDFLIASTLPALSEAAGMAKAMANSGLDYIISFVVRPTGTLLDGTYLHDAIEIIDRDIHPKPTYYMVNCTHPSILRKALGKGKNTSPLVGKRLIGLQANTSPKSPEELENSPQLHAEDPRVFAELMVSLYMDLGIKILGGCCGTDNRHIRCIADSLSKL